MALRTQTTVRSAQSKDRRQLTNLLHFESHVHRHLDWRPPLDWLGHEPYLVAERGDKVLAALACPPDPPEVAWVRIFAATENTSVNQAWDMFWPWVEDYFSTHPDNAVAAIPLESWFKDLLKANGFMHTHNVVMLTWNSQEDTAKRIECKANIRPMRAEDLEPILEVDGLAFGKIWRNSLSSIKLALQQASVAAVAEDDAGEIIGYQISTHSPFGAHLARLAVHPSLQGQGIGCALVQDLLDHFRTSKGKRISVNTQHNNDASLALYKRAGFKRTGEEYPIYQYDF